MSRTIDVEGGPRPEPFEAGAARRSRRRKDPGARPPVVVSVAAIVFGLLLIVGLLMAVSGRLGVANIDASSRRTRDGRACSSMLVRWATSNAIEASARSRPSTAAPAFSA